MLDRSRLLVPKGKGESILCIGVLAMSQFVVVRLKSGGLVSINIPAISYIAESEIVMRNGITLLITEQVYDRLNQELRKTKAAQFLNLIESKKNGRMTPN